MPFCSSSCWARARGTAAHNKPPSSAKTNPAIRVFLLTLLALCPRIAELPHGVKKTLLLFEPWIAVWHIVHAWYFCDWLWNVGVAVGPPASAEKAWHSRQSRFTCARISSRGFDEPCGEWHAAQPSTFTDSCSYTNGPALSVWHLKQT